MWKHGSQKDEARVAARNSLLEAADEANIDQSGPDRWAAHSHLGRHVFDRRLPELQGGVRHFWIV